MGSSERKYLTRLDLPTIFSTEVLANELYTLVQQKVDPDPQISPDRRRQLWRVEHPYTWARSYITMALYNCVYNPAEQEREPDPGTAVMALNIVRSGYFHVELRTIDSLSSTITTANYYVHPDGKKNPVIHPSGNSPLTEELKHGYLLTKQVPPQIDVAETARRFIAQAQEADPIKRFANPVLILPDGSIFRAPLPPAK